MVYKHLAITCLWYSENAQAYDAYSAVCMCENNMLDNFDEFMFSVIGFVTVW